MTIQQVTHYFPCPDVVGLHHFINENSRLAHTHESQGVRAVEQWIYGEWFYATNGVIAMRQPVHCHVIDPAAAYSSANGQGPKDKDLVPMRQAVMAVFKNRRTRVQDWSTISDQASEIEFYDGTPMRFRLPAQLEAVANFNCQFIAGLITLQGILMAEDENKEILHFLYDGGQAFMPRTPLWPVVDRINLR